MLFYEKVHPNDMYEIILLFLMKIEAYQSILGLVNSRYRKLFVRIYGRVI